MNIKFLKLDINAKVPCNQTKNDFGYDVYAVSEKQVAKDTWEYGLGFALQPVRSYETIGFYEEKDEDGFPSTGNFIDLADSPLKICINLKARSSVWKHGMSLANCVGTGDELYTGEYKMIFYHINKEMSRYKVGDKIGQLSLNVTLPMEFVEVEELDKTERGNKGFGQADNE